MHGAIRSASGLMLLVILSGCGSWDARVTAPVTQSAPAVKGVPGQPAVSETAPEIEGEDISGKSFKLSDYRGKVVMLDFWGNW